MDIKLSLVPEDFLERIKENPQLIFNGFEIRLAVDALRVYAKDGTQLESKAARELLKKAKIEIFIPDKSQYNKTDDSTLRYWQSNRNAFLDRIVDMENIAKPIWEKDKYINKDKKPVTSKILEKFTGKVPELKVVKRITEGERGMQLSNLILSIFAEMNEIDYFSIKNFYNRPDVKGRKKALFPREENTYFHTELIEIKRYLDSEINAERIKEKPQLGILAQREAYQAYIWKQYSDKKIPLYSFFWKLIELANE